MVLGGIVIACVSVVRLDYMGLRMAAAFLILLDLPLASVYGCLEGGDPFLYIVCHVIFCREKPAR
jgi:hypothetical protein